MVQFVQQQKRAAVAEHARAVWSGRLLALLPCVQEVVEVFRSGLDEPGSAPLVSVFADPRSDQWPLVVLFAEREGETGASAVFRCREDGMVCGIRYPFHDPIVAARAEQFADLGEPAGVEAHRLGHVVADFLEWASVGEGCGRRRLRFWTPAAGEAEPAGVRLMLVPAERGAA
jgi:hypothetical protein